MKELRTDIMGMPITVEVVSAGRSDAVVAPLVREVFAYFVQIDERFSPYTKTSEVGRMNAGALSPDAYSPELQVILALAEKTKRETHGFFDIRRPDGSIDPSGVVKGWAIQEAARLLRARGEENFSIDAGGDIQTAGHNSEGGAWSVGIRNPFARDQIVKVLYPQGRGVATSGTYERGVHIYNPLSPESSPTYWAGFTVVGPDVLEADRFATPALAMGKAGIDFIETLPGFEAYAIDMHGIATITSGFDVYTRV